MLENIAPEIVVGVLTLIGVLIANRYMLRGKHMDTRVATQKQLWDRIAEVEHASADRVSDLEKQLRQLDAHNDNLVIENAKLNAIIQTQSAQIAQLQQVSHNYEEVVRENALLRDQLHTAQREIIELRNEIDLLKR